MAKELNYVIRETDDFLPLSQLFNGSGMEVEISEKTPEATLGMWRADDPETGELLAATTIEYKSDCFVLENLAVKEGLRGSGLGKIMMDKAIRELKDRGAKRIWGCAKVPSFYFQYGWIETDRATAPNISHCVTCDQFNVSCFPCIIYLDV